MRAINEIRKNERLINFMHLLFLLAKVKKEHLKLTLNYKIFHYFNIQFQYLSLKYNIIFGLMNYSLTLLYNYCNGFLAVANSC